MVSLLAIGLVMARAATSSGNAEDLQAGLSLASVVLSWVVVHTVFTLRYARLYYEGRPGMTGTSADDAPSPTARSTAARRRSAGIYGAIVASAVLAAGGAKLGTVPLAVTVLVTLLVYWAAEAYAELLSEQIHAGHLPTQGQVRASLAAIWPMVSASYVPLLALLVARVLGATTKTAATLALVVAIGLLLVHGWAAGRAARLHGLRLLAVTLIAGGFGVVMILLKLVVTH